VIPEAFKLDSKNALVTGSDKGLGSAIALALAEAGANVAVHGRASDSNDIAGQIRKIGRKACFFPVDLSSARACQDLFERVIQEFGVLDILINNAGCIRRAAVVEFSSEYWDEVIDLNLTAVFRLCQLAAKHMLGRAQGGKIVNIASVLSFEGGIFVPSYAAAKGGVAQLTKALANEWAAKGINVNAIAPGYMETDNTAALRADPIRSRQSSIEFLVDDGGSRMILPELPSFCVHRPRITFTVTFWSWMVAGLPDEQTLLGRGFVRGLEDFTFQRNLSARWTSSRRR
jgi:2-dehydro-3-deoxy-D-gluconate 5-dehydrogenase